MAAAKRGCSGGYMGGEVDGVDDASLDGAELDLQGAEQLLPPHQEGEKQRGDNRGTRPFHERYEGYSAGNEGF